jgi:glycosyltransferase involved in cell wall biosynthesis
LLLPNGGEFGGLERHLLQVVEKLVQSGAGVQVVIICFGRDVLSERLNPDWLPRVRVRECGEPNTWRDWMLLLWRERPDVVVFCYGWIFSFPWYALLAAALTGIRRRFAIQHLILPSIPSPYPGKGLYGTLRRLLGERARRIYGWRIAAGLCAKTICVSEAVRASLVNTLRFSPEDTITVRNGVSIADFAPGVSEGSRIRTQLGMDADEFLLVCAARLSKVKGIDVLIEAIARVVDSGVPCKCVIVGEGPLRADLEQTANVLGLKGSVYFEGFQRDVRPYLHSASAFILTSHTEGLPLSVLEAMACGLPCIVTDVGGSAEAVRHNVSGLVISPASIDEAQKAIIYLATHPQERFEMAQKARETACTSFNLDKQMEKIVNVLLG